MRSVARAAAHNEGLSPSSAIVVGAEMQEARKRRISNADCEDRLLVSEARRHSDQVFYLDRKGERSYLIFSCGVDNAYVDRICSRLCALLCIVGVEPSAHGLAWIALLHVISRPSGWASIFEYT